jgi:hypothetical protein
LLVFVLGLALATSGCWNGDQRHLTLNGSLGQQLIDLQRARDAGALSEAEFERAKGALLRALDDQASRDSPSEP